MSFNLFFKVSRAFLKEGILMRCLSDSFIAVLAGNLIFHAEI